MLVGANFTLICSLPINKHYKFMYTSAFNSHTICCSKKIEFIFKLYSHSFHCCYNLIPSQILDFIDN
jgi:hypothetical protein